MRLRRLDQKSVYVYICKTKIKPCVSMGALPYRTIWNYKKWLFIIILTPLQNRTSSMHIVHWILNISSEFKITVIMVALTVSLLFINDNCRYAYLVVMLHGNHLLMHWGNVNVTFKNFWGLCIGLRFITCWWLNVYLNTIHWQSRCVLGSIFDLLLYTFISNPTYYLHADIHTYIIKYNST